MHEVYTYMNSSKVKLNELASHKIIQNNDLLHDNVLEVQSYIEQIDILMKYVDIKQNPDSIENLLDSEPLDIDLLKTFQKPNQYFKNLMKAKRLKYKVIAIENIPNIRGYPILRSIVNIMLDNAVKYSPNDSEIECTFDISNKELIIVMQNEGPYVESNEISNIAKQGFRGENAISTGRRGHGFGLDFLTEIVENIHFGKLQIHSTFKFQLNNIKYGTFECKIILPIILG
ncbi:MAG: sensor histidine kinase [Sphingomonadales bacterium]